MATIQPQPTGKTKRQHHFLKIDMTPMVDLGFLLITFFIFTTTMAHPTVTRLVMPADGKPTNVPESKTLTAILDKDNVYMYNGRWEDAVRQHRLKQVDYSVAKGLGHAIRQKQQELTAAGKKDELVLLVKPLPTSSYQNLIAALDEVMINNLKYYAVVDASAEEKGYVSSLQK